MLEFISADNILQELVDKTVTEIKTLIGSISNNNRKSESY